MVIASRYLFGNAVPVPEVYGWTTDGNVTFIYMEHIEGMALGDNWEDMSEDERQDICSQLRQIIKRFRSLEQEPGDCFVGNIAGQPLRDVVFTDTASPPVGPLPTVKDFHDLFVKLPYPDEVDANDPIHPLRYHLPDDVPIVFTHGDLHGGNIMISSRLDTSGFQIVSIIDWCQAGWLPSYWDYCKARWTTYRGEEWEAKYLALFLDPYSGYDYWDYFILKMGI